MQLDVSHANGHLDDNDVRTPFILKINASGNDQEDVRLVKR